jgi:potassium-dependent mechanosensitive channel
MQLASLLTSLLVAADSAEAPVDPQPAAHEAPSSFWDSFSHIAHVARQVWNYEIIELDKQHIYVHNVVLGLFLLALGMKLSRYFSNQLGKRVLTRFNMQQGALVAVQSIAHYALMVLTVMFVMNIVGIPLAALTVVGGAVALGIGFGSQNIVSNFISGLILLIERPIRIGDVVDVEGHHGKVERIGARSTQIRSANGLDIIVPNSALLDKTVINWTYADDFSWSTMMIGVAYGSDPNQVKKLLLQAANEHGQVVKDKPPTVLFADFGDNALLFKLGFCLHMRQPIGREEIESDLRFRIDELFRAANISMPFPQRDVHLDLGAPIDVRLAKT